MHIDDLLGSEQARLFEHSAPQDAGIADDDIDGAKRA